MVKQIKELTQIPLDKKVVCFATWCGPCQKVAPIFVELSEKFPDIEFLKVDVDVADEISEGFEVTSLPTFIFLNKGNIYKKIEGADLNSVIAALQELLALE